MLSEIEFLFHFPRLVAAQSGHVATSLPYPATPGNASREGLRQPLSHNSRRCSGSWCPFLAGLGPNLQRFAVPAFSLSAAFRECVEAIHEVGGEDEIGGVRVVFSTRPVDGRFDGIL